MTSTSTNGYETLLHLLISARKASGVLQLELAQRLDKPQSFVSKYERGERRLDVVEFITICRALSVDPRTIVGEVDEHLARKSPKGEPPE